MAGRTPTPTSGEPEFQLLLNLPKLGVDRLAALVDVFQCDLFLVAVNYM